MSAYIIVQIPEHSEVGRLDEFRQRLTAAVAPHQGKYIVRSNTVATLEGDWRPRLLVLVEFPSMERLQRFWASPEHAHAKEAQPQDCDLQVIGVEGL